MKIEEIATQKAPRAIGPYSQAVRAGGFVFVSGAIPIDPTTGEVRQGGIEEQTGLVLENLGAVLDEAGLDLSHVVKTTVYLADMTLFNGMNRVYGEFFKMPYPARATVEVAGLPKGVAVEIDAIAVTEKGN